ncbi:MAG: DUF484 family protein [Gammaproteobacteria bacterium]|nr:DUF484 family protein [Gammaproteobacteria bacterium]MBU1656232.1 DUF484 family protein [Gammaproteobacteria bacterium]MBU1959797.1 DUF484 family protein [Gammaproteobacteria bacterium]
MSKAVADYLLENPDFFVRNEDLLSRLRIPHPSGQAVSLLERQVHVLREQLEGCNLRLHQMIEIARENEILADRIQHLTLALIPCQGLEEMLSALNDELFDHFQADAVELRLFSRGELDPPASMPSDKQAVIAKLKAFLDDGRPLCGNLDPSQLAFIFGPIADNVRSTALVPLRCNDAYGILAIGSRSDERFNTGKGTLFLSRLSELVSRFLQKVSLPGV